MKRPHALLDAAIELSKCKNDAALCELLGVLPPTMSKIRSKKVMVSANLILAIHEKVHMSVQNIRKLLLKEEK